MLVEHRVVATRSLGRAIAAVRRSMPGTGRYRATLDAGWSAAPPRLWSEASRAGRARSSETIARAQSWQLSRSLVEGRFVYINLVKLPAPTFPTRSWRNRAEDELQHPPAQRSQCAGAELLVRGEASGQACGSTSPLAGERGACPAVPHLGPDPRVGMPTKGRTTRARGRSDASTPPCSVDSGGHTLGTGVTRLD